MRVISGTVICYTTAQWAEQQRWQPQVKYPLTLIICSKYLPQSENNLCLQLQQSDCLILKIKYSMFYLRLIGTICTEWPQGLRSPPTDTVKFSCSHMFYIIHWSAITGVQMSAPHLGSSDETACVRAAPQKHLRAGSRFISTRHWPTLKCCHHYSK